MPAKGQKNSRQCLLEKIHKPRGMFMNVNIFLYDDFETLDAFAPVSVFGQRPDYFHINYVSMYGDIEIGRAHV